MKYKYGWLAGVIDGEGTITITRQFRVKSYSYRPEIHITNTNRELLQEASRLIESATGKKTNLFATSNGSNRPVYRVRLQDRKSCLKLLKLLLPYLVGKKYQARVLLDFLSSNNRDSVAIQAASIRNINAGSSC
ncbi:MAG: LAGLIDADG family homing endonuclease [Candidatus Spechtbacterales bacterium]